MATASCCSLLRSSSSFLICWLRLSRLSFSSPSAWTSSVLYVWRAWPCGRVLLLLLLLGEAEEDESAEDMPTKQRSATFGEGGVDCVVLCGSDEEDEHWDEVNERVP